MARFGTTLFPRIRIGVGAGRYIYLPVLTTTQRDALSASAGYLIYNSTTTQIENYNGSSWVAVGKVYGDATFLPLAGGTLSGNVNLANYLFTDNFKALAQMFTDCHICKIDQGTNGAWSNVNVGGGTVVASSFMERILRTSATQNSSTITYSSIVGLNSGLAGRTLVNWAKPTLFVFGIQVSASDAQAVRRVQVRDRATPAIGNLAEQGVDLKLTNLALSAFAYGTSLSTELDLGTTITAGYHYGIAILCLPSTIAGIAAGIYFWVNGVYKDCITATGKFPTALAGAVTNLCYSGANGAAGTNSDFYGINFKAFGAN